MALVTLAVLAALVVLAFLVFGRGQLEARGAYLSVVSFIALGAAAVGTVVALNGVVDVAVPGQVRQSQEVDHHAGPGRRFFAFDRRGLQGFGRTIPAMPGLGNRSAPDNRSARPAPNANAGAMRVAPAIHATRDIRSRGWVRLLRGLTLVLVGAGLYLYHWRYIRPPTDAAVGRDAAESTA